MGTQQSGLPTADCLLPTTILFAMYLSKIELFGFKSFAHKVRIKFDKGLTAIVGPNGCGKTNVVDAMRWVLGEQKSSLLRSAKMENIIFNGSKNLKPLSLTEVSLTIENTRKACPRPSRS